jgi:sterol 24-C-methyltransferase
MPGRTKSLEKEDKERDASFNKALHGKSSQAAGGIAAMFSKDKEAKQLAVDEYFKHFDNKTAKDESAADREVRIPSDNRQSRT